MLTHHAEIRCQQRGIRGDVVDALLAYGRQKVRHGAEIYFMDRKARERAMADMGRQAFCRIADKLDSYLVVADDGSIVTVAKRLRRLKF